MSAKLRVDLIAWTTIHEEAMTDATDGVWRPSTDRHHAGEALAEFAGRACYASFHKPNVNTRDNRDYLAHIIEEDHTSVLGHPHATFYLQGVSRSFTHELVRHHVGTRYSQLSQRYVDAKKMDYVVPPAMRGSATKEARLEQSWTRALTDYNQMVYELEEEGKTRKQAREAARAFLPGCAETKIVVSGNLEAWRHIIAKRATQAADAEMREVMVEIGWVLKKKFPNAFQDMHMTTDSKIGDSVLFFGVGDED